MIHDIDKLPKWAQQHINYLEDTIKYLEELVDEYKNEAYSAQSDLNQIYENNEAYSK